MERLIFIITANFLISLASLIGVFTISIKEKILSKFLLSLISLSAGALMGGAFLHLLPEASEKLNSGNMYQIVLFSFILFFLIEKLLHWRHCHKKNCDVHTFGYMNLFGDAVHNFIDGLVIAATFLTDIRLGIITSFAIALHEIPQEIGDFGVLLYSGFSRKKALFANFLVALTAVFGGIIGYFLSFQIENMTSYLLPFTAGGFIYIAASDLMPEIRKETSLRKSMLSFGVFLVGIAIMFLVKFIGHE
ncbi:ZIP family metal transporter [Candidatus Gottesmanbacteria bacterium CG11_big_fil_rev_8_21_14_0_20_37_11]|uniref:ZIP family metal transporter n=3 Tax=Candidatus Gottesmaniibacteriota TaxID=1752720 RepID=A0A2M7RRT0_9BACT|nr:MAG: ZIP family metal transporter [Candidatus Gottesmanbacteria bacterium CG1_02_37_22]PIP32888.1 MAG: ZIP family metal transporter [Candidatus Gottesmanbacteria bacterium CG23_combo_of_CG06-09_8_20_14_all_37_19]PIR08302.1 MAG: ZIP family metal transporter [Candidatus Gottesmanbacteria bacterium CG11_big_fil_rev_8_21_14_0_20_37_11]PIZ03003.1 MAG: ZIP family metal transporter [Candidatus Gottesmanbacteria bacterium CG_4_10_14_0_8_um_filter_37_24]